MAIRATRLAAIVPALLLALALAIAPASGAAPEAYGQLQIKTVPGVSLLLDGKDRALTAGEEGFTFREVAAGPHRIEAALAGSMNQTAVVLVQAGALTAHRLRPFQPLPPPRPAAPSEVSLPHATGALILEPVLEKTTIESSRLGWKKIPLGEEPFVATSVPKGRHKITFCNAVKCIDYWASIKTGDVLSLRVALDPGTVQDVTRERKAEWTGWRDACANLGVQTACFHLCKVEIALEPEGKTFACAALFREAPIPASRSGRLDNPPGAPSKASQQEVKQ